MNSSPWHVGSIVLQASRTCSLALPLMIALHSSRCLRPRHRLAAAQSYGAEGLPSILFYPRIDFDLPSLLPTFLPACTPSQASFCVLAFLTTHGGPRERRKAPCYPSHLPAFTPALPPASIASSPSVTFLPLLTVYRRPPQGGAGDYLLLNRDLPASFRIDPH